MSPALIKTLAATYILLIAVIIAEWSYATHAADAEPQRTAKTEDVTLSKLDLTEKTAEDYQEMVARPLFIQNRRPVEPSLETEDTLPVNNQKLDIDLTAIFSQNNELNVFFKDFNPKEKSNEFIKAKTGSEVKGWTVSKIDFDHVIMKQGNQQQKIDLINKKEKTTRKKLQRQNKKKVIKDKKNRKTVKKDKK